MTLNQASGGLKYKYYNLPARQGDQLGNSVIIISDNSNNSNIIKIIIVSNRIIYFYIRTYEISQWHGCGNSVIIISDIL